MSEDHLLRNRLAAQTLGSLVVVASLLAMWAGMSACSDSAVFPHEPAVSESGQEAFPEPPPSSAAQPKAPTSLRQPRAATSEPSPSSAPQRQRTRNSRVKEVDGFRFVLKRCEAYGEDLSCEISATDSKASRQVSVNSRWCRIITEAGDEFFASSIGKDKAAQSYEVDLDLPVEIEINFWIRFNGLARVTGSAALLEVQTGDFTLAWRDVTFP
ncbi:MAG: hypothetical protein KDD11_11485 [Acidobacteria bacterium]|nr:hypothetical protein [Acidobacteriota bacterium]